MREARGAASAMTRDICPDFDKSCGPYQKPRWQFTTNNPVQCLLALSTWLAERHCAGLLLVKCQHGL